MEKNANVIFNVSFWSFEMQIDAVFIVFLFSCDAMKA